MSEKEDQKICPRCQKAYKILAYNKYRPFCTERCRIIDLGQWLNEKYVISQRQIKAEKDKNKETYE